MYYSQPELTQSPGRVNWITRDICCMLEAKPWELGVFSSSKGLLAGNIRITLSDDDIIDCNLFAGGKKKFINSAKSLKLQTSYYRYDVTAFNCGNKVNRNEC